MRKEWARNLYRLECEELVNNNLGAVVDEAKKKESERDAFVDETVQLGSDHFFQVLTGIDPEAEI